MKFRFYFLGGDITSTQIDNESVRKKNPDVITVHVQDEGKGGKEGGIGEKRSILFSINERMFIRLRFSSV